MQRYTTTIQTLAGTLTPLMNQQCWCWGHDVRRSEGNLLLGYGFERTPAPAQLRANSAYTLKRSGQHIGLWGFGIAYGHGRHTLYMNRYTISPLLVPNFDSAHPPHLATQIQGRAPATTAEAVTALWLMHQMLRWIGSYEHWVVQHAGEAYRAMCVETWQKGKVRIPAAEARERWSELARTCQRGSRSPHMRRTYQRTSCAAHRRPLNHNGKLASKYIPESPARTSRNDRRERQKPHCW